MQHLFPFKRHHSIFIPSVSMITLSAWCAKRLCTRKLFYRNSSVWFIILRRHRKFSLIFALHTNFCCAPPHQKGASGGRSFRVLAATLWNALPSTIRISGCSGRQLRPDFFPEPHLSHPSLPSRSFIADFSAGTPRHWGSHALYKSDNITCTGVDHLLCTILPSSVGCGRC